MKKTVFSGRVFESEVNEDDLYRGFVTYADVIDPNKSDTLSDILLEQFSNKKVIITIEEVHEIKEKE